jgi:hypothetical protein
MSSIATIPLAGRVPPPIDSYTDARTKYLNMRSLQATVDEQQRQADMHAQTAQAARDAQTQMNAPQAAPPAQTYGYTPVPAGYVPGGTPAATSAAPPVPATPPDGSATPTSAASLQIPYVNAPAPGSFGPGDLQRPPDTAAPDASAVPATPPDGSGTIQTAATLQTQAPGSTAAVPDDTTETNPTPPTPNPPGAGGTPPATPAAGTAQTAAGAGQPQAAGAKPTFEQVFAEEMYKRGQGEHVAPFLQARAQAQEQQLRAQAMQREANDEQLVGDAIKTVGGDPYQALALAAKNGASPDYIVKQKNQLAVLVANEANAWNTDRDADLTRAQDLLPKLAAFMAKPPADRQADWKGFVDGAHADNVMSTPEYYSTLKAHPDGPPDATELGNYQKLLTARVAIWSRSQQIALGQKTALMNEQNAHAAEANQKVADATRSTAITQASYAPNPAQFNQILTKAGIDPHSFGSPSDFYNDDGTPDPDAMNAFRTQALNAEQLTKAKETDALRANTAAFQQGTLAWHQQDANTRENKVSPAQQKIDHENDLRVLDNKVMTDTMGMMTGQGKSATAADVVTYLKDPSRWGDNPDVSANRAELIQRFEKMGTTELNAANIASRTTKNLNGGKTSAVDRLQWMKDHPGQPVPTALPAAGAPPAAKPTGGGRGAPAAPAPKAAAPVAAKPAPAGRMRVKLASGQTGTIDAAEFDSKTMTQLQ